MLLKTFFIFRWFSIKKDFFVFLKQIFRCCRASIPPPLKKALQREWEYWLFLSHSRGFGCNFEAAGIRVKYRRH
jgi:hypothetical protein